MSEPLRVALIGYGLGGRAFHAPLIAVTPGLRLVTIVTSNTERRAQARADFPDANIIDLPDAVWANAAAHDLAVITTPNRFHVPLARAAIAAGIAVVVDKPMAASAKDARELVAEAAQRRIPLTAYHNRRWDGEMLTAQRLIASGELGEVLRFESRLDRWRPGPVPSVWRERGAADEAGGVLFDLGSHLFDQARVLFGPVVELYAELEQRRPGAVVPDDIFIALRHAKGVRSHLWAGSMAAQAGARMRVLGTRAAYVKQDADVQEAALRAGRRPDTPGFGEEPEERWGRVGVGADARPIRTEKGNYALFYAQVVEWLRGRAPPPVDPADAIAGLDLIEAAQRSAAEATVVRFPQGC
ncbi:MAG TPA: Gfo/Idh/MocA family oxidoreductase [Steroidobacteraceae bacterium]